MKFRLRSAVFAVLLIASMAPIQIQNAAALTVTATGTNPAICNQNVGSTTGVTAYRITGGDCVVEFRNAGAQTSWTTPAQISNLQILVVGGGGGGAGRHSGGGGGGGVIYVSGYGITSSTSYNIYVGSGGAGSTGTTGGYGNAGQYSYFSAASGSGSIVANGGGGGGGGNGSPNQGNFDGTLASSPYPSRGSGGGSNYHTTSGGASAPGSMSDGAKTSGSMTTVSFNSVNSTVYAYGNAGGAGKGGSACLGPTGQGGWCGGGGGGGTYAGSDPYQPNSVNPWHAGDGGTGVSINISGSMVAYAGGGGGGAGSDQTYATNAACKAASATVGSGGAGGGGAGGQCQDNATSGTANTGGGGGGGGLAYVTGSAYESGNGGNGGSGIVIVRYTPDSTAPSFMTGPSFTVAENTSIATTVATLTVSESSTIEIYSGADSNTVTIGITSSTSSYLRFKAIPDYEAPIDVGANNVYEITIRAIDLAGNSRNLNITITVTNANEVFTIGTPTFSAAPAKGTLVNLSVTINAAGKVRFLMDGKRIAKCLAVTPTGTYPNLTATCAFKPSVTMRHSFTAVLTPTDNTFTGSPSEATTVYIIGRTSTRS